MKFSLVYRKFNLLEIIPEKLLTAIHCNDLSPDDVNKIKMILTKFEMYISSLNPKLLSKSRNIHKDNGKFNDNKQFWQHKKSNQDHNQKKPRNEENWRKLKPEKNSRYPHQNLNDKLKSKDNEKKNPFKHQK